MVRNIISLLHSWKGYIFMYLYHPCCHIFSWNQMHSFCYVFFVCLFLHDIFSFLPWIRMNSALLCSLNMLRKRIHTYVLKRCVKILYMCLLECILHGFVWKIMPRNKLLKSLSNLVNTF